ncbi:hypothetical protein GCM10022221_11600 [Actinocorallia aurea]
MGTQEEITVRFNPAIGWGFVAGAVIILGMTLVTIEDTGIVGFAPVVTILAVGVRFLTQRNLAYDPAMKRLVVGNGRAERTYQPHGTERLLVEDGRIVFVGSDGARKKVPATRTWADRPQWDRVVEAIEADAA